LCFGSLCIVRNWSISSKLLSLSCSKYSLIIFLMCVVFSCLLILILTVMSLLLLEFYKWTYLFKTFF
jgi:hypothetical protein